jgi:hypothetical protein
MLKAPRVEHKTRTFEAKILNTTPQSLSCYKHYDFKSLGIRVLHHWVYTAKRKRKKHDKSYHVTVNYTTQLNF